MHTTDSEVNISSDTILLHGILFPIIGTVRRRSLSPLPQKVVQGDYSRKDRIVESEWILTSLSGGLGIRRARAQEDETRSEIATIESRYRDITLPPEVVRAGTLAGPSATTPAADMLIEYSKPAAPVNLVVYAIRSTSLYWWNDSSSTWTLLSPAVGGPATLDAAANSVTVHDGVLYIVTDNKIFSYNASTDTWASQAASTGGYALVSHDDKLWRLDTTNTLKWAITSSITTWNTGGKLLLPSGFCNQLILFPDQTGVFAIHAITKRAVYGYDEDTQKFWVTPLDYPSIGSGKGASVWQGALYVPVGSGIYRYTGSAVQVVGPDKDDGLPPTFQGSVKSVIAGHGFYYCTIDVSVALPAMGEWYPGLGYMPGYVTQEGYMVSVSRTGAVLASPGAAWHLQPHAGLDGEYNNLPKNLGGAIVSNADNKFKLWYADSEGIWYQTLPTGLHNPLNNPATRFAKRAYAITPSNSMGWEEHTKVATSIDVESERTSSAERIEIWLNFDDTLYEKVLDSSLPGRRFAFINNEKGKKFRNVKQQIIMYRGSDATKTPVLRSSTLGYIVVPPDYNLWEIDLDLTDARCKEMGTSASDLIRVLYEIWGNKEAGTFTYRGSFSFPHITHRVWVHNVVGAEDAGSTHGGRYTITLLDLDDERVVGATT